MTGIPTLNITEAMNIANGIRLILRAYSLTSNDQYLHRVIDPQDVCDSVKLLAQTIQDTSRMCGRNKRTDQQFDHVHEISEEMAEILLTGKTPQLAARNRQRYNPTFHMIIRPIIQSFTKFSHIETLAHYEATVNWVLDQIDQFDEYGSYEDGILSLHVIRRMVAIREKHFRDGRKALPRR